MYTYIGSVEIDTNSIKFELRRTQDGFKTIIKIEHPREIALLPDLLNGDMTGYDALQSVEHYINKKHNHRLKISFFTPGMQQADTKKRIKIGILNRALLNLDPFISLCWFFPRKEGENDDHISYARNKVVSDEITESIKNNFPFIDDIKSAYARGAAIGVFDKGICFKRLPTLPVNLIGTFLNNKDASILAQTCKSAFDAAKNEYETSITKAFILNK